MQVIDEFSFLQIEEEHLDYNESNKENQNSQFNSRIVDHTIIRLSNDFIPKGLVPLKKLFDHNVVPKNPLSNSPKEGIKECNIETLEEIRNKKTFASLQMEVKDKYLDLLRDYKDAFSWSYSDLKTYDTTLIEHKIPLKLEAKPFKQYLRIINPVLLPTIEKELKKILDDKIIVPLRYFDWVANLVLVRNKNGEIKPCVDFRNLNKSPLNDNYPLPKMDQLLQKVSGSNRNSMLDVFYGYN